MQKSSRFTGRFLSILAAFVLMTSFCRTGMAVEKPPEPFKLKILILPFMSFAPFFVGLEEGYFAEEGLELEFLEMRGSEKAVPLLIQGKIDIWNGSLSTAFLNAAGRSEKIKFVADRGYLPADGCAFSGFVARKDLVEEGKLKHPGQLKGLRVVVQKPSSVEGYRTDKLLERGNLTMDDIEMVNLSYSSQLEAFGKGTIDLSSVSEPWVVRLADTGKAVLWLSVGELLPDFQISYVAYGPNLLEKHPEIGRRFMKAYIKSLRQYSRGKTERNLEIIAQYTKLDRDILLRACWPSINASGHINVQTVLDFQDWAVKKGFLDQAAKVEQFWDPSFVDKAGE